ncbi:MAG: hypothetical protein M0Z41_01815 [Peptococcaceae bacterium]|nr:hypothetical protein [Peptococcaceae bacterium]
MKAYSRNQVYKTIMIIGTVIFSLGLILGIVFKDYQSILWFAFAGSGFVSWFGKLKRPYALIGDGTLVLDRGRKYANLSLPAITITRSTTKKVEFMYNDGKGQKRYAVSLTNLHKRQRREFLEDFLSVVGYQG